MENEAVVVAFLHVLFEVGSSLRRLGMVELDLDNAVIGLQYDHGDAFPSRMGSRVPGF